MGILWHSDYLVFETICIILVKDVLCLFASSVVDTNKSKFLKRNAGSGMSLGVA